MLCAPRAPGFANARFPRGSRQGPPGGRQVVGFENCARWHGSRAVACEDRNYLALRLGCAHRGAAVLNRHVQLAAHSEATGEVDAWFDRKAGRFDQGAMVLRFQRIQIRTHTVDLAPNRVAGSVYEGLTVAGLLDHGAGGAVLLVATNCGTVIDPPFHQIDRCVARPRDDFENPRVFDRDSLANETRPGDIRIGSIRTRLLGPQVEQYEVSASNRACLIRRRPEMRIGTVLVYRDDGWFGGGQSARGDS